jgi:hypothetical protein
MLERQKILRETDNQRTPNGILRVYEHRKSGTIYLIRDPDIPLSQVESVQNEVIVLLENNGRVPEPVFIEEHAAVVSAPVETEHPATTSEETVPDDGADEERAAGSAEDLRDEIRVQTDVHESRHPEGDAAGAE